MKKFGFTLAEVLITLVIIGVIAALTIPTFISKYVKITTEKKLVEGYSIVANGLKTAMVNTNCSDLACTGIFSTMDDYYTTRTDNANTRFYKAANLKILNNYLNTNWYRYCAFYKYPTGDSSGLSAKDALTLANNITINIDNDTYDGSVDCQRTVTINGKSERSCGNLYIITDHDSVNRWQFLGRNVFEYIITNDGRLLPYGLGATNWSASDGCDGTTASSGRKCAARILQEGWKINYWE